MSGKIFECGYGAIVNEDVEVLEMCLSELIAVGKTSLTVCEIGMHDGGTAKGIENWLTAHGIGLRYYGIDIEDGKTRPRHVPFGGTVILGDSLEVFDQVPDQIDLLWVDGCHCFSHVVVETLLYSPKVRRGGFMCFHDVNPSVQGEEKQPHGPDVPEFRVSVNHALGELSSWLTENGWSKSMQKIPEDIIGCGTRAYRKSA